MRILKEKPEVVNAYNPKESLANGGKIGAVPGSHRGDFSKPGLPGYPPGGPKGSLFPKEPQTDGPGNFSRSAGGTWRKLAVAGRAGQGLSRGRQSEDKANCQPGRSDSAAAAARGCAAEERDRGRRGPTCDARPAPGSGKTGPPPQLPRSPRISTGFPRLQNSDKRHSQERSLCSALRRHPVLLSPSKL